MMASFSDWLQEIIDEYGEDEVQAPPEYEPIFWCAVCRDHQVDQKDDVCPRCVKEQEQGYQVRSLAGRCANGAELDHGTLFHALEFGEQKAMCGAKPGRRSAGWSTWGHGKEVTCKRCLKRLENK